MDTWNMASITRRSGMAAVLALLVTAPTALLAAAPADLSGDWQGKLAIDANNALTVRFTFTRGSNGAYTAVLNSPDNPGVKDTAVSNVTWDGTSLKFAVPTLSGAYAGTLRGGRIAGEWTQPGGKLPLELAPWSKPVLSADAAKPWVGAWNGAINVGGTTQTLTFNIKQGANGLEGTFGIPDQGVTQPLTDVMVENGELTLRTMQGRFSYSGKLNGNRLVGKMKIPSPVVPPEGADLVMQRGEYQVKPVPLKLSAQSFASLQGKWNGTVVVTNPQSGQTIQLPIVLRFERNAQGEHLGYLDSPSQGVNGMVVSDATLEGNKFTVRVGTIQSEYVGTLAGSKITGEWSQGGQRLPLELNKAP